MTDDPLWRIHVEVVVASNHNTFMKLNKVKKLEIALIANSINKN